mgnify:CR=1 FL=1
MDDFNETLRLATQGDLSSVEQIIRRYQPLINKNSICNGRLDEDLRQYIELQIFRKISKFKLYDGNPK